MAEKDHITDSPRADAPPQAPEIGRTFHITLSSGVIGVVLLAIVVLAVLGFFGATRGSTEARGPMLELHVEYPTRLRYKQIDPVRVYVRNLTGRTIDTLTVSFDPAYHDPFSNVSFTPSASGVWNVRLTDVKPGERRRVQVGLQGERYGRHEGQVAAFFAGADTVRTVIGTLVFP